MKRFLLLLMTALLVFTGCETDAVNNNGRMIINVNETIAKGIEAIPMDTDHYTLKITGDGKTWNETLKNGTNSMTLELKAANYTVEASAINKNGQTIGYGSNSVDVVPFQDNPVNINVTEIQGTAKITFSANTEINNLDLKACIWSGSADINATVPSKTIILKRTKTGYVGTDTLDNGFYTAAIYSGAKRVSEPISIRIVTGYDFMIPVNIEYNGNLDITIGNAISKTPSITLSSATDVYGYGDTYTVTATVNDMVPERVEWYMDTVLLASGNSLTLSGSIPGDGSVKIGKHIITCVAYEGTRSWSEKAEFQIFETSAVKMNGKVEVDITGSVLLPRAIEVVTYADGVELSRVNTNTAFNKVYDLEKPTALSFKIENAPGYTYTLRSKKEADRTVLSVIVDSVIPDSATLNVTFAQTYKMHDNSGSYIYLIPDGENLNAALLIPINNWGKEASIKVPAGKYSTGSYGNYAVPSVYRPECNIKEIITEPGKPSSLTIGERPYGAVTFTIPNSTNPIIDINRYSIHDSESTYHIATGYMEAEAFEYVNDILKKWKGTFDVKEGNQNFTLEESTADEVLTGLAVKKGDKIRFTYDLKAPFPEEAKIYYSTGSKVGHELLIGKTTEITANAEGELKLIPTLLSNYIVSASVVPADPAQDRPAEVRISIALPEAGSVKVNFTYCDFTYSETEHDGVMPLFFDTNNVQYALPVNPNVRIIPGDYTSGGCLYTGTGRASIRVRNFNATAPDMDAEIALEIFK